MGNTQISDKFTKIPNTCVPNYRNIVTVKHGLSIEEAYKFSNEVSLIKCFVVITDDSLEFFNNLVICQNYKVYDANVRYEYVPGDILFFTSSSNQFEKCGCDLYVKK